MNTNYVKWHKQKDLEKIAADLHVTYQCKVPIDIDYLVETMNLELCVINRLKEDFGLFGLLAKIKGKYVIFVGKGDFRLTNYSTNFTIAEELSHYILHKQYFKNVRNIDEAVDFFEKTVSQQSEMMIEFNAKYLAGAILLPAEDLKDRSEEVYLGKKSTIAAVMKTAKDDDICDAVIDGIASSLTDVYRVPDRDISYRLRSQAIGFKNFVQREYKQCQL